MALLTCCFSIVSYGKAEAKSGFGYSCIIGFNYSCINRYILIRWKLKLALTLGHIQFFSIFIPRFRLDSGAFLNISLFYTPASATRRGTDGRFLSPLPRFLFPAGYRRSLSLSLTPLPLPCGVQMAASSLPYPAFSSLRGTDVRFLSSLPRFLLDSGDFLNISLFYTPCHIALKVGIQVLHLQNFLYALTRFLCRRLFSNFNLPGNA